MKYQLYVTDKADHLIRNHLLFIGSVSKQAAKKQASEFKSSFKKIAEDPKAHPFFEGQYIPYNKYHKFVVSKRYIVLYQIIESVIYIDYVIDTRTDYSWLIK